VTTVSVSGNAPNIGATSQFTATATLSNSTTQTVTPQATWISSNASVATVNGAGLVTGVGAGSADISATYQSVSGLSHLSIIRPTFTVSGTVRDDTSNGVLPNINVSSVDSAGVTKTTRTNGTGGYSMGGLAAGIVAMTFSATGYQTATQSTTVAADTQVSLSLTRVDRSPSPTPTPPSTSPTLLSGIWVGDATLVSLTGVGCGSMSNATRSGVLWAITQTGSSLSMDEDMSNWPTDDTPYTGTLSGTQFTAKYVQPQQAGVVGCVFQGGDLSGSFSEDGAHFDAIETNVWVAAGNEVRMQRHWTGRRF
jgi:hypothetical protein